MDTIYRFDIRSSSAIPLGKVPRLHRRGIDGECGFAYETPGQASKIGCVSPTEQFSRMKGAWVLGGGRFSVVHADVNGEERPPARVYTCRGFLSIVDWAADVACVDVPVPGGDDSGTFAEIEEDVLYTLDRRLDETSIETWLLEIPIPIMAECPEGHVVHGWRVEGNGQETR